VLGPLLTLVRVLLEKDVLIVDPLPEMAAWTALALLHQEVRAPKLWALPLVALVVLLEMAFLTEISGDV
jgi:hypothetical protein